ncbi:hypothetical protein HDU76_007209 [Blyttiomyces sp. JEL0837]|nr:hypothetical protein HDU76_007209 [Blyttiomyces sp. JEL0837]
MLTAASNSTNETLQLVLSSCIIDVDVGSVPHGDTSFLVGFLEQLALQAVFKNPSYRPANVHAICVEYLFDIDKSDLEFSLFKALENATLRLIEALKPKSLKTSWIPKIFQQVTTLEGLTLMQKPSERMENLVPLRDAAPFLRSLTLQGQSPEHPPWFESLVGLSALVNLHTLEIQESSVVDFDNEMQHCDWPKSLVCLKIWLWHSSVSAAVFHTVIRKCPLLEVFDAGIRVTDAGDFCLQCATAQNDGVFGFPRMKRLSLSYQMTDITDFILFAERLHLAFPKLASLTICMEIRCQENSGFSMQLFRRVLSILEGRSLSLLDLELLVEHVFVGNSAYTRNGFRSEFVVPIEEFFRPRRLSVRFNLES